jgi:sugar phosphate isomerase/epimerase
MTVSPRLLRLTRAQMTPYAMRMRISFSTGTFYHRPLAYSLRMARALGYDGVEYVVGPDYFLSGVEPLRKAIDEYATPVLSIHPPFHMLTTLPLTNWPRQGGWAWPRTTALGRELGATLAVTHTVFLAGAHVPRMARYQAALRMGREAGGGLILTIESNQYNRRGKRFLLDDLQRLVDFAQEQDCGVTLDTCHAGANGEDLLECYEIVRPALRNIHLSDVVWRSGHPRTHVLPGEGELPLREFLSLLAADGYDGLVTLEIHPRYIGLLSTARAKRRMGQALAFVRASIASEATPASEVRVEG